MRNSLVCPGRIGVVIGLVLAAALFVHAQGGPPSMEGKTAEQVYKNIKVLTGTPANQLVESMHLLRGALGVECDFCHEEDRAADTKKEKETARAMMRMMMDINKSSFNGQQVVTCYTCHRGSAKPVGTLLFGVTDAEEESKIPLPSIDQVLAKYVEALGGEQAIRKVGSRVITGTQFIPTGVGGGVPVPAAIERDQKSPNLVVNIYHTPTYTISDGFDGTKAWAQDMMGRVNDLAGIDQVRAKRDADFYLPLDLKQEYMQMQVQGVEKVNGHDAYVVVARPQGDSEERLYFDMQTGLLLRKWSALPTPVGDSPFQVDYDNYQNTSSGVKFPYLITKTPASLHSIPSTSATIRVTKVQDNALLDSSKFEKPKPKATGAQ